MRMLLLITIMLTGCLKAKPTPSERDYYHPDHVRLRDVAVAIPVREMAFGSDPPRWVSLDNIELDQTKHLWLKNDAWAYPTKSETHFIKVMPHEGGVAITVPKGKLGVLKAGGGKEKFNSHPWPRSVRVMKLEEE